MAYDTYNKDAAAVKDYLNDWQGGTKPFLAEDEAIADSTFTAYAYPASDAGAVSAIEWELTNDITIDDDSFTDTTATVWLSGGTPGAQYLIVNHVTTDQGREDDWTIKIKIKQQ